MAGSIALCCWGAGEAGLGAETQEALTMARSLAADLGGEVTLVALGAFTQTAAEEAAAFGAARVDRLVDAALSEFAPDLYVAALASYFTVNRARAIVFPQTFDSRLVSARLSARLDAGVIMNCVEFAVDGDTIEATVAAFGGDTRARYRCRAAGTYIFSINPNAVVAEPTAETRDAVQVREVDVDLGGVQERITILERPEEASGPRLEHAQVVVAGGRGLGEKENFRFVEELAEALGGMAGASRPIVDDGWATPAQQVGLTGKITKPALYIAAGISGASQHMVGCAAAKTLVAINRDPDAAIFRYAKYGIVGNCLEILPELTAAAKKAEDEGHG
jgi:electron transfer flavoprotein alpha subunit